MRGTINPNSLLFDPELEKTIRKNRKTARQRKLQERGESSVTIQEEVMEENHRPPPHRTLGDYMTPTVIPPIGSVVRPTVEPDNFELKPALVQLVQKEQFAGTSAEDLYLHIENFLLLSTVKINGVTRDAILLRLFTHSLKDDARRWLQSLPQGSITTWDDLQTKFLSRFFSASKRPKLKNKITGFKRKESESIYESRERFKTLLRKCPQHGIEVWNQAAIFLQGLTTNTRTLVNAMAGGSLTTKTPQEALDIFESLASQEFDNAPVNDRGTRIIKLDGYDALLAKNDQMMQVQKQQQQQLDTLTKQLSSQKVASVDTNPVCAICGKSHVTDDCDYGGSVEQAEVNGGWYDQRNHNNQGQNVYVPPWENRNQHPGFSYSSNHQLNPPLHPPPHSSQQGDTSAWEKAFAQLSKTTQDYIKGSNSFREETYAFMQETKIAFRNQEASIRNLETQIEKVEKDRKEDEVVVENNSSPQKLMKWEKKKMTDKQDQPVNLSPYAKVPYPQRLKQEIQKQHYARYLGIFKKLQINIPFAEALENMPHYAKFMKDLLSKKRKLKDGETVALTEECSALIQKKLPPKLKDPGSFSILIAIGDVEVGKALCDLGASINLMPLSVCRALEINKLKDTNIILHLADRSIKKPEGVVEDVLVKVDKFIFPVDFVILDMEEKDTESPLFLGRPFLGTARSLIDVEQGKMMLREVVEEVIGEEDFSLEKDKFKEETSVEYYQEEPKIEELEKKVDDIPKGEPKVELKELPSNLKYVFLGDDQTYPAIINALLSEGEEVKLIEILMEEEVKPVRQPQRRLNPTMKEVVKKEVVKLLDAGMIYPISDSAW
ncbi:uncharacterized protein LOC133313218, partial [Gastrolobium bilobum]|uniref:uncharacterized protein LOC133313218 n=1 Tax=Gastrolobium bilobum TaxID=150636 RepID=UPI002AB2899E